MADVTSDAMDMDMDMEVELKPVSFSEFSVPSYDAWKAEVEKALKGGSFDKKMYTKTYEGITLEPIYTPRKHQEAIAKSSFPGAGDFLRGSHASGYIADTWGIAQYVEDTWPQDANRGMREEIEKGATVYSVRLDRSTRLTQALRDPAVALGKDGVVVWDKESMKELCEGLDFVAHPVYMEAGPSAAILLATLWAARGELKNLHGVIGADPLGCLAREGRLPVSLDTAFDEMAHTVHWAKEHTNGLRTILVSGDAYHNGGGNDVQELAYLLATAVAYVRQMRHRGLSLHDIAQSLQFTVSLGANFFMEIAKLRALRVIWAQIMEAFGAEEADRKVHIHGRTSAFTKTVYDPYVNMLRDTTQAFSGVVGGLDSLEVSPFDAPIRKGDVFSRRISRNIQVMMATEFELRQPVDPAGGSWYIETLAQELMEKIWAEFQTIEAKGGMVQALQEGYPQEQVAHILEERFQALDTRRDVAVGNNMYANMTETLLEAHPEDQTALHAALEEKIHKTATERVGGPLCEALAETKNEPGALLEDLKACADAGASFHEMRMALQARDIPSLQVTAIPAHRWTEKFEALRMTTEDYVAKHHDNVKVFLANMGPIPQHKPRADFSTGFMEVAAFEVIKNDGFDTTEKAAIAAEAADADVVVICSTDATYPELVPPLAREIRSRMPDATIFLAGMPAKDMEATYREAGVDDFIHVRANCYAILHSLQEKKGMMG